MALARGKQVRRLAGGGDDYAGQKANTIVMAGGVVMIDASGRALPGAAATGCIGVGLALTNKGKDRYDATGLADNINTVRWDEGIFAVKNGGGGDAFASTDQPGIPVWIIDDETGGKTSSGGTRSPMGRFYELDPDGTTVWVEMGKKIGAQLATEVALQAGTALAAGAVTGPKIAPAAIRTGHFTGHNGAAGIAVTSDTGGAFKAGDVVVAVVPRAGGTGNKSSFEAVLTVNGQIQQSSVSDLSAVTYDITVLAQS